MLLEWYHSVSSVLSRLVKSFHRSHCYFSSGPHYDCLWSSFYHLSSILPSKRQTWHFYYLEANSFFHWLQNKIQSPKPRRFLASSWFPVPFQVYYAPTKSYHHQKTLSLLSPVLLFMRYSSFLYFLFLAARTPTHSSKPISNMAFWIKMSINYICLECILWKNKAIECHTKRHIINKASSNWPLRKT